MTHKIEAIKEVIRLKEQVMRESQTQIRQAQAILENMQEIYRKAMEDKLYLQQQLIEELEKAQKIEP